MKTSPRSVKDATFFTPSYKPRANDLADKLNQDAGENLLFKESFHEKSYPDVRILLTTGQSGQDCKFKWSDTELAGTLFIVTVDHSDVHDR